LFDEVVQPYLTLLYSGLWRDCITERMRIVCPACSAAYEVPDEQLHEGRIVRCARCGTDWAPAVAVPEAEPEPPPEPEPAVPPSGALGPARAMALSEDELSAPLPVVAPARVAAVPPQPRLPLLGLAWAFSALVLLGGAAEAYLARDAIMRAWPPITRAYAALGLARGR